MARRISGFGTLTLLALACNGSTSSTPDAGTTTATNRLVVLDPPGDLLGVRPSTTIALPVRYEDPEGRPIVGAAVDFAMKAEATIGEEIGGSTLSANEAITDEDGIARVDLVAGAASATFRVQVSAPNASTVAFSVGVSEEGFSDLIITPEHGGWRDAESFASLEVRLYRPSELRCADYDPDAPVPSTYPVRSLESFGGAVRYQSVPAGEPYTAVAWAQVAGSDTPLAAGCMEIAADQLQVGPAHTTLLVLDRQAELPGRSILVSTLVLDPMVAALDASPAGQPWRALACPEPGQLLIDCALDLLGADGTFDCVVQGSHPTITQIEAARGAPDASGCRPATAGAQSSVDALVTEAMDGQSFPAGSELTELLADRAELLAQLTLRSELDVLLPSGIAVHRLRRALATVRGQQLSIDLLATSRPLLRATQIPITYDPAAGLAIAEHGFTLRAGSIFAALFATEILPHYDLSAGAESLGAALIASIYDGANASSGCEALSKLVCTRAGLPGGCIEAQCQQAQPLLDDLMAAGWRMLDGPGLDLTLQGSAPVFDLDSDLTVDAIGTDEMEQPVGQWSASFVLQDGSEVPVSGAWGSTEDVVP